MLDKVASTTQLYAGVPMIAFGLFFLGRFPDGDMLGIAFLLVWIGLGLLFMIAPIWRGLRSEEVQSGPGKSWAQRFQERQHGLEQAP